MSDVKSTTLKGEPFIGLYLKAAYLIKKLLRQIQ